MEHRRPRQRFQTKSASRHRQGGAVAIIVALSMAFLVGMVGLALDGGRLYTTKSELQTVADACALGAVRELACSSTDATCLPKARAAGTYAAGLNKANFQGSAATVTVDFTDSLGGTTFNTAAPNDSRFVRCTANLAVPITLMQVIPGVASTSTVSAAAMATLAPSSTFSAVVPFGVCSTAIPANVGDWISATGNDVGNIFRWVDAAGNSPNAAQVKDRLSSTYVIPSITIGTTALNMQTFSPNAIGGGFNTRFGIYSGSYNQTASPPDFTGYAFPITGQTNNIFAAYQAQKALRSGFNFATWTPPNPAENNGFNANSSNGTNFVANGISRRLIVAPILNCASGVVTGAACLLLLNPIGNGSQASIRAEYRGSAASPTSPCPPLNGAPGGSTATGPLVPTLVQ